MNFGIKAVSTADFGKIVRQVFPEVRFLAAYLFSTSYSYFLSVYKSNPTLRLTPCYANSTGKSTAFRTTW